MATSLRRLLAVACAAQSASYSWHQSVLEEWASHPSCAAAHLADSEGAKCGAGAVVVSVPEDLSEEASVQFLTAGAGRTPGCAPFGKDALIEVASISKVFTALVLLRLVDDGNLRLDDTVGSILQCKGTYNHPAVLNITMVELASHTSGLPSVPDNRRLHSDNPYEAYSEADLCECLQRITELPTRGVFHYSNLAFGLLGYLMELHMGQRFEKLAIEHVFAPLGMHDTRVTLADEEWSGRVAPGLNASTVRKAWRRSPYGVLQGNGAFHSSLVDMAKFISAAIRAERGDNTLPLSGVMRRALQTVTWDCPCFRGYCEGVRCRVPSPERSEVALGWQSFMHGQHKGWHKAGDTEGYSSFLAYLAPAGRGAFGFDTCGGCGVSHDGSGSSIQKAVQQLVRGAQSTTDIPVAKFEQDGSCTSSHSL